MVGIPVWRPSVSSNSFKKWSKRTARVIKVKQKVSGRKFQRNGTCSILCQDSWVCIYLEKIWPYRENEASGYVFGPLIDLWLRAISHRPSIDGSPRSSPIC